MNKITFKLAARISRKGGQVFYVGGFVRDSLLGIPNKDVDLEVFGIAANDLESLLQEFAIENELSFSSAGKSFWVHKLRDTEGNEIDISLPRKDRKISLGHKGFESTANPFMSLREAASRRDFTINAVYRDVLTGELSDPFNGCEDLKNKIIRMVEPKAFSEDPLRVLRAIQFASRFEFNIDTLTLNEMRKVDLTELPAERVFGEWEKLLLKGIKPGDWMRSWLWIPIMPELNALWNVPQDKVYHPEGDVLTHTCMVVNQASKLLRNQEVTKNWSRAEQLTFMLACLCHDFGKASTTTFEEGRVRAHGHSEAGLKPTEDFLNRLNIHTIDGFPVRQTVLSLVQHHLFPAQLSADGTNVPRALRRMAQKVRLDLLAMVSLADTLGRGVDDAVKQESARQIEWFLSEAAASQVVNKPIEPILKGRHLIELGMKPGPQMGEILRDFMEMQLDGKLTSLDQALKLVATRCSGVFLKHGTGLA